MKTNGPVGGAGLARRRGMSAREGAVPEWQTDLAGDRDGDERFQQSRVVSERYNELLRWLRASPGCVVARRRAEAERTCLCRRDARASRLVNSREIATVRLAKP